MNYTLLVVFAACLIGCGAQRYTNDDLKKYCDECMKDSSISSNEAHPYRCDYFITCVRENESFKVYERTCGLLYYNKDLDACVRETTCNKSCNAGDKFRYEIDCNKYFECVNGSFNALTPLKSCGERERFSEKEQKCVKDDTCAKPSKCSYRKPHQDKTKYFETKSGIVYTKDCEPGYEYKKEECDCVKSKKCTDEFRLTNTPGVFQRLVNGNWTDEHCIRGYNFNLTSCTCADKIPSKYECPGSYITHSDQDKYYILENSIPVLKACPSGHKFSITDCQCHPDQGVPGCFKIDIPMWNDTKEIHGGYVHNDNVTIENGAALFNSSQLIISSTANNDLGNVVQIKLEFFPFTQKSNKVAILGNGRCKTEPTLAVYLEGAVLVVKIVAYNTSVIEIRRSVTLGSWQKLSIVKNKNMLQVQINGFLESRNDVGNIVRHKCAIGIGDMSGMDKFYGLAKNFYLAKCL